MMHVLSINGPRWALYKFSISTKCLFSFPKYLLHLILPPLNNPFPTDTLLSVFTKFVKQRQQLVALTAAVQYCNLANFREYL